MSTTFENLDNALFQPLAADEVGEILGGEAIAPVAGGFTFLGRTQHGDHIDNDYTED